MAKRVLILRRHLTDLNPTEKELLLNALGGEELECITSHPNDHLQHVERCRSLQPAVVLLPLDTPIPSTAMKEGFRHVAVVDGQLKELIRLDPIWKNFEAEKK